MLPAVAATIDSIMKPVFGTPAGTGVFPIGGFATQTPTAKISPHHRRAALLGHVVAMAHRGVSAAHHRALTGRHDPGQICLGTL